MPNVKSYPMVDNRNMKDGLVKASFMQQKFLSKAKKNIFGG
jgi:hypothetical protein